MWISLPNWIVIVDSNSESQFDRQFRISTTRLYRRLGFRSNFSLILIRINQILIKIDWFWSISIIFWLKDWKRPFKCWLFNQKSPIISKMVKNNLISIKFNHFRLKSINFEIFNLFSAADLDFVVTIQLDFNNLDRKSRLNDNLNTISNEIWF